MSGRTKIELSFGLIALIVLCLIGKTLGEHWLAVKRDTSVVERVVKLVLPSSEDTQPIGSPSSEIKLLPEPATTNYAAQGEIKYQCGPDGCGPYPGQRLPDGSVVVSVRDTTPTQKPAYIPKIIPPQQPDPTTPRLPSTQADAGTRPAVKKYQLLLFLDGSSKSEQLAGWFGLNSKSGDMQLMQVKEASSFQYYTQSNALYRERLSKIVTPDQFPAVLLLDADGGHIHACGKLTIPDTPAELFEDMRTGNQLYIQAKTGTQAIEAQDPGMVKTDGYNFADFVSPKLRLESADEDCPDGICPVDPPTWRPGDKVRDGLDRLFDRRKPDGLEGLFISWVSGPERIATLLTYVLIGLIIVVAYFKFRKVQ